MKAEEQISNGYILDANNELIPIYNITTNINEIYNTPLTVQDVVTIINLAKNGNESKKWPVTIEVVVNGTNITNITNIENFFIQNLDKKYKCTAISIDAATKIVKRVEIMEI